MPRAYPSGFYVYAYLRSRDSSCGNWTSQTPYYIGKGKSGRAWQTHYPIPRPKDAANILILADCLAECEAHALEKGLIVQLGRTNIKTGPLRNLTNGGEGQSGRMVSAITRAVIRDKLVGRKFPNRKPPTGPIGPPKGTKFSAAHCAKIGDSKRGRKVASRASSPYFGVHWNKTKNNWRAFVRFGGNSKPLGTSADPIVCARLYDRHVTENGLDRPLNFPGEPLIETVRRAKIKPPAGASRSASDPRPYSRVKRAGSSSPYYGVHWVSQQQMWRACVCIKRKLIYLGSSPEQEAVALKYDAFVIENGLDWPLNFPLAAACLQRRLPFSVEF